MVLAASSGNVEALRAFKDAGAPCDETAILGGVLYATPLLIASIDRECGYPVALLTWVRRQQARP